MFKIRAHVPGFRGPNCLFSFTALTLAYSCLNEFLVICKMKPAMSFSWSRYIEEEWFSAVRILYTPVALVGGGGVAT